ncbi:hypothetical protein HanOQP8_Chr16g0638221 [Helianthus annuus]|nr:hypothetical protein HanOQP8_Chr16g0638221 [Helianthus annuus]
MKLGNTTCFIFLSFPSLNETLEHKIFLLSFCFLSFPSVSKLWNIVLVHHEDDAGPMWSNDLGLQLRSCSVKRQLLTEAAPSAIL